MVVEMFAKVIRTSGFLLKCHLVKIRVIKICTQLLIGSLPGTNTVSKYIKLMSCLRYMFRTSPVIVPNQLLKA